MGIQMNCIANQENIYTCMSLLSKFQLYVREPIKNQTLIQTEIYHKRQTVLQKVKTPLVMNHHCTFEVQFQCLLSKAFLKLLNSLILQFISFNHQKISFNMEENLDDFLRKQEDSTSISSKSSTESLAVSEKSDTEYCTTKKSTIKYMIVTIVILAIGLVSIGLYSKFENLLINVFLRLRRNQIIFLSYKSNNLKYISTQKS